MVESQLKLMQFLIGFIHPLHSQVVHEVATNPEKTEAALLQILASQVSAMWGWWHLKRPGVALVSIQPEAQ